MDSLTTMKPGLLSELGFVKINHVNRCRFNFLASNVLKSIHVRMNALLLIIESICLDRYLNSGANLLKLTEVVWLYLALLIHVNYYCFHSLKFIKFVTFTPGRLKVYLRLHLPQVD